jgi:hypothetical protein
MTLAINLSMVSTTLKNRKSEQQKSHSCVPLSDARPEVITHTHTTSYKSRAKDTCINYAPFHHPGCALARAFYVGCAPPPSRESNRSLGSITSRAAITARLPPPPTPHPSLLSIHQLGILSAFTCIIREVFGPFYLVEICHACLSIHSSPYLILAFGSMACTICFSLLS